MFRTGAQVVSKSAVLRSAADAAGRGGVKNGEKWVVFQRDWQDSETQISVDRGFPVKFKYGSTKFRGQHLDYIL